MKKRAFIWGLVALAFILLFPFSASASIVDYVDLTPEQTLALYGNEISGIYWNGSEYDACTFTYCYTFEPVFDSVRFYPSNGWSESQQNYFLDRKFLIYEMDADSLAHDNIIQNDSRITLSLSPSISISGISYYRQFIGFSCDVGYYFRLNFNYNFISNNFNYSSSPSITHPLYSDNYSGDTYNCFRVQFPLPFSAVGSPPSSGSGVSATTFRPYFSVFDVYGQHLVDGVEQTFSLASQELNFNQLYSYGWSDSSGNVSIRDYHYFIFVSCPRLTDGYVIEQPETTPNYGGQLDDINISIGSTNTLLQQIIAKLDLIYAKMDVDISGTVNISSSSVGNIVDGIIDGIHDLFVPSQTDLLNFRTHLMTELHSAFPAFFTAEDTIHDAFQIFDNVQSVSTVRFPGVSVDFPSGVGTDTVLFSLPAQDVELKPEAQRFSVLYDALALILDIVCTFAVFNMVKSKFHKIFEGSAAD